MPEKINLRAYKIAVLAFYVERRCCEDPTYKGEGIAMRPRNSINAVMEGEGDGQELTEGTSSSIDTR